MQYADGTSQKILSAASTNLGRTRSTLTASERR
jgi:hypothetical protein